MKSSRSTWSPIYISFPLVYQAQQSSLKVAFPNFLHINIYCVPQLTITFNFTKQCLIHLQIRNCCPHTHPLRNIEGTTNWHVLRERFSCQNRSLIYTYRESIVQSKVCNYWLLLCHFSSSSTSLLILQLKPPWPISKLVKVELRFQFFSNVFAKVHAFSPTFAYFRSPLCNFVPTLKFYLPTCILKNKMLLIYFFLKANDHQADASNYMGSFNFDHPLSNFGQLKYIYIYILKIHNYLPN